MNSRTPGLLAKLRVAVDGFTPTLHKLGVFVLQEPERVMYQTVTEVAEAAAVSEASVIRLCQKLGFKGFHDFKMAVAVDVTSGGRPSAPVDTPSNARELVAFMVHKATVAVEETARILEPEALESVARRLNEARRIVVFGVGNSAIVAHSAAIKFLRLGLDAQALIDPHLAAMAASQLGQADVAIGVSSSGSTIDIVKAIEIARRGGAFTVSITNQMLSPLTAKVDAQLVASAPETPLTGGALASKISQLLIVDVLAGLIPMNHPERLEALRVSAEAILDRGY